MNDKAFLICFHSLSFTGRSGGINADDAISEESYSMLRSLYGSLQQDMYSAENPERKAARLKGNIFACCLPEGYAMLLCRPNANARAVKMTGFLLRRDESLRTAWKLARWQILVLCAKGWDREGSHFLTPDQINDEVKNVQFDRSYMDKLLAAGQEMLRSETPFSFALTNYPLSRLSLDFRNTHVMPGADGSDDNDGSEIVIDRGDFSSNKLTLMRSHSRLSECIIASASPKELVDILVENLEDGKSQKKEKARFKEELKLYGADEVWYIRFSHKNNTFIRCFEPDMNRRLCMDGLIDFEMIYDYIDLAEKKAETYFRRLQEKREAEKAAVMPDVYEETYIRRLQEKREAEKAAVMPDAYEDRNSGLHNEKRSKNPELEKKSFKNFLSGIIKK